MVELYQEIIGVTLNGPYHIRGENPKTGESEALKSIRVSSEGLNESLYSDKNPAKPAGSLKVTASWAQRGITDVYGELRIERQMDSKAVNDLHPGQVVELKMTNRGLTATIAPLV